MRANLMRMLEDMRRDQTDALNNQLDAAMDRIEKTAEDVIAALEQQVADSQSGKSPLALERKRVQGEIKKIYYRDSQNNMNAVEDVKGEIRELVEAFKKYAEDKVPNFGEAGLLELQAVIDEETKALCDAIEAALKAWNDAADEKSKQMSDAIDERIKRMEGLNKEKRDAMDAEIARLTEDFIAIFWDTVDEIYNNVNYYERQGLIWKALYQKDEFIAGVQAIRQELVAKLAQNQSELVAALNAERDGMAAWIGDERIGMQADTKAMKDELKAASDAAVKKVEDTIEELAGQLTDENAELKKFVYDLATIQYSPKGNGDSHANGYQPYGKWVVNRLNKNISVYGDDTLATFDTVTTAAVDAAEATLASEQSGLATDSMNAQDKLNNKTQDLIENLIAAREAIEMNLAEQQAGLMDTITSTRDMDQITLITIKNNLWKELSWIVRQTLSGASGHKHGLSAGPVYGYLQNFAQV